MAKKKKAVEKLKGDLWEVYIGDALEVLKSLSDNFVHCIITSPPYFGLRDNQMAGQIGLEISPQNYIDKLVLIFREARRVLRGDGTFWLNLGDTYVGGKKGHGGQEKSSKQRTNLGSYFPDNQYQPDVGNLKPKNLMMIPAQVALALRQDGWYLRSEIVWHKTNAMVESVTDRPTRSHEMVYLLTKAKNYFYDQEAIKEPSINPESYTGMRRRKAGIMYDLDRIHYSAAGSVGDDGYKRSGQVYPTRNRRTVWTVPTSPFWGAHFSTFPLDLIDPMILAGTSARGCCPKCGMEWARVVRRIRLTRPELSKEDSRYRPNVYNSSYGDINGKSDAGYTETITRGWQPGCSCYGVERIQRFTGSKKQLKLLEQYRSLKTDKCIVLDPFAGSGTTIGAAVRRGRKAIGIELNPKYVKELVARRVEELRRVLIKRKKG